MSRKLEQITLVTELRTGGEKQRGEGRWVMRRRDKGGRGIMGKKEKKWRMGQ